jgi:hypothetical protein
MIGADMKNSTTVWRALIFRTTKHRNEFNENQQYMEVEGLPTMLAGTGKNLNFQN